MTLDITFLGTGTSVGIPMIGCGCPVCESPNPKDKRLRSSLFMTSDQQSWVVDTGPDFRQQCLRAGIEKLDTVLYTHHHTDHIVGFDDLRRFTIGEDEEIPLKGSAACLGTIHRMFPYAFDGSMKYRGYIKPRAEPVFEPFALADLVVSMLPVVHGKQETHGYLFSRRGERVFAYFPDIKAMPEDTKDAVRGVKTLCVGALRRTPHFTHQTLDEAVDLARELEAEATLLTHFMCEVSHEEMEAVLPPDIRPAFDGLRVSV